MQFTILIVFLSFYFGVIILPKQTWWLQMFEPWIQIIVWNFQHSILASNTKNHEFAQFTCGNFFYMKVWLCKNMKNPLSLAMVIKRGVFTIFTIFVWLIWLTKISEINNLYIQSKTLIKLKKEALLFTCTLKSHRYLRSIIIQLF